MLTLLRYSVVCVLLNFIFVVSASEFTPDYHHTQPFELTLTLGKHACALESRDLAGIVEEDIHLHNHSSIIYRVPDSCVAVLSRLRASIDQAVWLSLSITDQSDWLKLHTIHNDRHTPQLDKRGRYFGCAMPENGFHTCRIGFEMRGQRYQVFVPMRVGVLKHYGDRTTVRKTRTATPTKTIVSNTVVDDTPQLTTRYGRGISIPELGFYSGITTFPLANGTWQIAVEEPLVGHLQGTAWINDTSNIVLAGHSLHSNGANGIFAGLYHVNVGQEVILNDNNIERRYVVTKIHIVHYQDISVAYPTQGDQLTMLTCHIPSYNRATNNYDQRLVVVAEACCLKSFIYMFFFL